MSCGDSSSWIEYSDDCSHETKRVELELRVVPMSSKKEPRTESEDVTPEHHSEMFSSSELVPADGKLVLKSPGHSEYYDIVCLDRDGFYVDAESALDREGKISISPEGRSLEDIKTVCIVDLDSSDEFEIEEADASSITYDNILQKIEVENKKASFDSFLAVYDTAGKRVPVNPNVNARSFVLSLEEVSSAAGLRAKSAELQNMIDRIAQANSDTPSAMLYALDSSFRECVDKKEEVDYKISALAASGKEFDISRVFIYRSKKSKTYVLQEGASREGVIWERDNKVRIEHGLGGVVKVMVDDSYSNDIKFKARYIDSNAVELEFLDEVLSVYSVTMYKI